MSKTLATLLAASVLALVVAPANASAASAKDTAAAHNALTAGIATMSTVIRTWPKLEASLNKLDQRFATECPDVGAGSPQSESEQRLAYEVAGALWATGYHTEAPIIRKFINKVTGFATSNPKLNRRVYKFLNGLNEMIALPVPDICADVRAWTATGYRTVPTSALQFADHVEAINVEFPSPKLADPYLTPSDKGLVPKLEHLIIRFEELEFKTGIRYWNKLLETVGLNQ